MKKILKLIVLALGLYLLTLSIFKRNIAIDVSPNPPNANKIFYEIGDTLSVLSEFDFTKDNWISYVVFSDEDISDLPNDVLHAKCLFIEDRNLFMQMQKKWKFAFSGGDMATITSKFYLFRNGNLVFKCGILATSERQGLQSSEYGWLQCPSDELVFFIKYYKIVNSPIVLL